MLAILQSIQEARDRRERPVPRNLHPKQHGCVLAYLAVEPGVPAGFRHGLFGEPREYLAAVRFSSAKMRDDRLPDAHGMSVKLFDVDGERLLEDEPQARTQDLVCVDHPVFFARDVADLLPLLVDYRRLMIGGPWAKARTLLRGMVSLDRRFRILRAMVLKRPTDLLRVQFWSTTPVRIRDGAMKLSFRPQRQAQPERSCGSADRLRLALAARLESEEARFDLVAQLQTDPTAMPIEDATVCWDESTAPYQKIATLRIPVQRFDTPAQRDFGENLSFTPWHGLAAHRPLGGINRARQRIYQAMAAQRRTANGAALREPTADEWHAARGGSR